MKIHFKIPLLFALLIIIPLNSRGQEITIDHVISVHTNLDTAAERYSEMGFTIKPGRLHSNGLLNAHIKFQNNSSYELMSVVGEPMDDLARNYKALLDKGEGGVFIAISGISTDQMEVILRKLKIQYELLKGRTWNYITFDEIPSLSHLFFIESFDEVNDPPDLFMHKNNSVNIKEVVIDGDQTTISFLEGLGLIELGRISDPDFGQGIGFRTETGDITVIVSDELIDRPRIKAISFGRNDGSESIKLKF